MEGLTPQEKVGIKKAALAEAEERLAAAQARVEEALNLGDDAALQAARGLVVTRTTERDAAQEELDTAEAETAELPPPKPRSIFQSATRQFDEMLTSIQEDEDGIAAIDDQIAKEEAALAEFQAQTATRIGQLRIEQENKRTRVKQQQIKSLETLDELEAALASYRQKVQALVQAEAA